MEKISHYCLLAIFRSVAEGKRGSRYKTPFRGITREWQDLGILYLSRINPQQRINLR